MEPKQIVMLTFLLLVAVVGCGMLVWVMMNLDKEEEGGNDDEHGGGH